MLTYSIAIRTLGTSGDKFRQELESIAQQSVQPLRVVVYIAEGYSCPGYTVSREEYVWVRKGMMSQRVLTYNDIDGDCLLLLDDDVLLAPDSARRMLEAMEENGADCVGADTFKNHQMNFRGKCFAAITNLVFPHYSAKWAFKIHRNGSFSYNSKPRMSFYWSQSCAGPASMWRKSTFVNLHLEDELWLENNFEFAYGDDVLEFYKLYKNGYKLGILYNSGLVHLDAGSASEKFKGGSTRMYIRSKATFAIWWRTCYNLRHISGPGKALACTSYIIKAIWLFFVMCAVSLIMLDFNFISSYIRGQIDGWRLVHSPKFVDIPLYDTYKKQ